MSRMQQEIEEDLAAVQGRLETLQSQMKVITLNISQAEGQLLERKDALNGVHADITELNQEIVSLTNELSVGKGNEVDFGGCPHEWQRQVIVFMRNIPGVEIHYSALLAEVSKNPPNEVFTKARAAMLNLMGHLISKKLVAKAKNGNYKWVVYPAGWKAPSVVLPLFKERVQVPTDPREAVVREVVQKIRESGEAGMRELEQTERLVTQICTRLNLDGDQEKNIENWQYVERELIKLINAPNSEFEAFGDPEASRPIRARKNHLVRVRGEIVRGRAWEFPAGWETVVLPMGMKQESIGTRRRGH